MKAQGTIAALCALLILASTFNSCKKDNDKKASCKLVKVTQNSAGNIAVVTISYNTEGKISAVTNASSMENNSKVFTYSGNTINVVTTSASGSRRDSITIDASGRPVNIRIFYDNSGTSWTNNRYEYNGKDLARVLETTSSTSTTDTTKATYSSGNMVTLGSGTSVIVLDYHTDKNTRQGDYLGLVSMINYGVITHPHKNLLKSISNGSGLTNFAYDIDADGKIINAVVTTGSNSTILNYEYQCN